MSDVLTLIADSAAGAWGSVGLLVLAVLGILLVFRFTGCGSFETALPTTDPYPKMIRDTAGLVAYWRLAETGGTTAVDEVKAAGPSPPPDGKHPGEYKAVPGGIPADDPQSGAAGGTFTLGQPSLLDVQTDAGKSASFDGGFVRVPFAAELNPPTFTVEAWVRPSWGQESPLKFHSVVTSRQDDNGQKRGFMLYAGPPLPGSYPPGKDPQKTYWQFWIGTGGSTWVMLVGPETTLDADTHLMASCDGTQMKIWVDGGREDAGAFLPDEGMAATAAFVPNQARPLYIAGGKTDLNGQTYPPNHPEWPNRPRAPRYPFQGRIQDVALYSVANVAAHTHAAVGSGFTP